MKMQYFLIANLITTILLMAFKKFNLYINAVINDYYTPSENDEFIDDEIESSIVNKYRDIQQVIKSLSFDDDYKDINRKNPS